MRPAIYTLTFWAVFTAVPLICWLNISPEYLP